MNQYPTDKKVAVVFQDVPEMEGLDFCLMYFDDNTVMYMSPTIRKRVDAGERFDAEYFVLSYRRSDKPIEEIVKEIKDEIKTLPGGKFKIEARRRLVPEGVQEIQVSPLFGK